MNRVPARTVKTLLIATFVVLMVVLLVWFKLTQPRILVLHSYDPNYVWSRDTDIGLRRVLGSKLRYRIQWHYMDVKNHPEPDFKRRAALLAHRAIESWNPNLIIALDDDAQEYVVKHVVNRPGLRIVFAGINGSVEPYGYHKAQNVTGVLERRPLHDLREALLALRASGKPAGRRLVHIGDRSRSVSADDAHLAAFDWAPFTLLPSRLVATIDDWKQAVARAGEEADIILVSNYRGIRREARKPELVPPEEVVRWTVENARVPVIGLSGFFVEDGGTFALGTSAFEQGSVAASMALRILDRDLVPKDIPVATSQQFIVYMRGSALAKRHITLPRLYESFARATNNYYE